MKRSQLNRLREEMEREVEITNAGLDNYRGKIRVMEGQLNEQRASLQDRKASTAEATAKLQ
jgi:hypothetical protein